MTPHCPQPFYVRLVLTIAGNSLEIVENIIASHLAQSPQQVAGIIEHDTRVAAFGNQLGDEFSHAGIAPSKDSGVVVIPLVGIFKHMLEIAD